MIKNKAKGLFITIEGGDGTGKSTQTKLVIQQLKELGYKIVHSREPGGTDISEKIRHLLLDPKNRILPLTELLLYEAARYQNTLEIIRPALSEGKVVICERYIDASTVYQGFGRNIPLKLVHNLNMIATGGLKPDITFIFDMDYKIGLSRARAISKMNDAAKGGDRLERENFAFHKRVSEGYRKIAEMDPKRISLISVHNGSIKENFRKIMKKIRQVIRHKKSLSGPV